VLGPLFRFLAETEFQIDDLVAFVEAGVRRVFDAGELRSGTRTSKALVQ
jgi:hypothetical protein